MQANPDPGFTPPRPVPHRPWLTGGLLLLTVMFFLVAPRPESMAWSTTALADAEPWRLLTGHWIHSDLSHLAWNALALAILGALIERHSRKLLVGSLLAGHLAVTGWLMSPGTSLAYYCGLSGVLHTLLVSALLLEWRWGSRPLAGLVAALSGFKLWVELSEGTALLTQTHWPAVPPAHLAGVLGGIALLAPGAIIRASRYDSALRAGRL